MLKVLLSWPARVGLTIFLGIVFVFFCFQFQWFQLVDLKIYDLGLYLRPQAEFQPDVVVVAIDRYSRENCFPPPHFPVSNHINEHCRIINRLSDAGAKVIAFDILFDQLDSESDVEPLVSALNKARNVILAGVSEAQSLKVKGSGASFREERVILPVPGIPFSSYQVGLVNVPIGPDQVARQSYYGKEFQGKWYPSFPAAVAIALLRDGAPAWKITEPFFIDYSSPRTGITTIRYADVLKSDGWQSAVKGRVVLIGVTENGLGDSHKSPLPDLLGAASGDKLPGVFFLAYATQTLLSNRLTTTPPGYLSFLLGIFLVTISSMLALGKRHVLSLILIIILIMVALICGLALTALSITILPTGKLIAITLLTAVIGMFVNFSYTKLVSFERESQLQEIASDLKAAQQIQQRLQPEKIPLLEGIEISGLQIPCKEIGGDYYDVMQLDNKKVAILIADVSGKGISGALVMSNLQSVVRTLSFKISRPSQLLPELNQAVSKVATPGRFVTLFYGVLDLTTKKLLYGNAGHNYPILCRADGATSELAEGGLFLGPFPQTSWQDSEVQLKSGDILLLYTDGITEAAHQKTDEQFGEERLKRFIRKNLTQRPDKINQQLVTTIRTFTGSSQFEDDFTLLTLKIL